MINTAFLTQMNQKRITKKCAAAIRHLPKTFDCNLFFSNSEENHFWHEELGVTSETNI